MRHRQLIVVDPKERGRGGHKHNLILFSQVKSAIGNTDPGLVHCACGSGRGGGGAKKVAFGVELCQSSQQSLTLCLSVPRWIGRSALSHEVAH